jgi:hypothetical protein
MVLILSAPYTPARLQQSGKVQIMGLGLLAWMGICAATILMAARVGAIFPLTPLLLLPLARGGRQALVGASVALFLFAAAIWWNPYSKDIPLNQWIAFAVLGLAIPAIWQFSNRAPSFGEKSTARTTLITFLTAFVLGLFVGNYSMPFNADITALTAWHHWGAYLSPVDLFLSGGVPYRDFPVQYGIGPTLLLAAGCGHNCWNGMFHIVLVSNALYVAVLAACVSIIVRGAPLARFAIALIAMFCASMVWTAFPSDFGSTMATPSVAGLRFLPLAALLLFVLKREEDEHSSLAIGHVIWLFNIVWSIEAAAFASLVWWPWLAYRQLKGEARWKAVAMALLSHALMGAVSLATAYAVLLLLFYGYFATWPEVSSVFAYIQHPPGVWPLNPHGSIWFVLMVAVTSILTIAKIQTPKRGMLYACSIACVASFSYFLSRAHDNNILNLLPFILLVILCLTEWKRDAESEPNFGAGFAAMAVMVVVIFATLVDLSPWKEASEAAGTRKYGALVLTRRLEGEPSEPRALLPMDALLLIEEARKSTPSAPLLFDKYAVMPVAKPGTAWTSINNIANYSPLPSSITSAYIQRSAAAFKKSGWLIVEDGRYQNWPQQFSVAYRVKLVRARGRYKAYFMSPIMPSER